MRVVLERLARPSLSGLTRNELLERAKAHIFSTGVGDGSSLMARENMKYGLAKIQVVQEKFGLEPDATFVSTPDESITRNVKRWEAGISYGGKISWGRGNEKLVILDVKPNACGMLVGGVDEVPDPAELVRRIYEFEKEESVIDGIPVKWDFNVGNHFIDVFETRPLEDAGAHQKKLPQYAVIVHAGAPELKGDNPSRWGFGLYWHKSKLLEQMAQKIPTPFGPCNVLQGNAATGYLRFFAFAEEWAKKRRALFFKKMFGSKDILLNKKHQGMLNTNEVVLGAQNIKGPREILPISIRADMPSYLVRGVPNFSQLQIETLGWNARAHELGVYDRLKGMNIIPHGGGYLLADSLRIVRVFEANHRRFFEIEMIDGMGRKIVATPAELEYAYRSTEVIERVREVGMARFVAELVPIYTIKI